MRVLLFEPNPYHYEVIPGFAYYLIRSGYEVDCLLQEADWEGDVFSLCPSIREQIRFFHYRDGEHRPQIEALQRENPYDLLFATSFDRKKKGGWEDLFRELLSCDQSRLGVIGCYHALNTYKVNRENGPLPTERIVSLSPVDTGEGVFREVNANYYCDRINSRPKNQITRILSIGHNTDRYALQLAAESVRQRRAQQLDLVCVARKIPIAECSRRFISQKINLLRDHPADRNFPPLFHRHTRVIWSPSFETMFREIEKSDFLDASVLPENSAMFSKERTSGTKQLSLGFLKPCIIEKDVAEYYGFSDRSAIIYETGKMEEALSRAACMPENEYREMVTELKKLCDEVRARSERNLKALIEGLEVHKEEK